MTTTTYAHLPRYTRPANFADFGDVPRAEYFVAYGQHRDSDSVTRSNFRSILSQLGGESETVLVLRDSHWAVGWVEAIYVHESNTVRCEIADKIREALEDYPLVDESDHSELEWNEAADYWASCSVRERVDWITRANTYNEYTRVSHPIPVFAARRAELPDDDNGRLFELLTRD